MKWNVILGVKSHEGNISLEMYSDEFFLEHALVKPKYSEPLANTYHRSKELLQ